MTKGDDDHRVDAEEPAFGPSGYLPAKASARARKIVLRAPLGLQWMVAAVVAGAVILVAGGLWLTRSGPPDPPFVPVMEIAEVDGAVHLPSLDALVVTAGGPVVVFADASGHRLAYCPASGRVEGDHGVWSAATGRGWGVESLARHPSVVHDGILYVNPGQVVPGPPPSSTIDQRVC